MRKKTFGCIFFVLCVCVVTKMLSCLPTFATLTGGSRDSIDKQRRLTSVLAGHGSQAWPTIPLQSADLKVRLHQLMAQPILFYASDWRI